jgi:hypothetical protein
LWAHANPDSYSCANADSNTYRYSNSYAYTDSYAYGYSDSYAYTHSYAYRYSDSYAYAVTYGNCDSHSYAHTHSYAYVDAYGPAETKPDTKARCDTAASPVSDSGKLIVHSAAGVERPRLRAFVRQSSSHPGTKFAL